MKSIFTLLCCVLIGASFAQNTRLEYSRVLIVNNNQQTVPAGKVWKVSSIYGMNPNLCVNLNSGCYYGQNSIIASTSSFQVNGSRILSECTVKTNYASTNCTGSNVTWTTAENSCYIAAANTGIIPKTANPNILPIWLPSGTTVVTDGPQIFLSIIEFSELP